MFLFFAKKETYIDTYGTVKYLDIDQTLTSPTNNPIKKIHVQNGEEVTENQLLITFENEDLSIEKTYAEENVQQQLLQLQYLDLFKTSLEKNTNVIPDNTFGYSSKYKEFQLTNEKILLEKEIKYAEKKTYEKKRQIIENDINLTTSKINDYEAFIAFIKEKKELSFYNNEIAEKFNIYINEIRGLDNTSIEKKNSEILLDNYSYLEELNTKITSLISEKNDLTQSIESTINVINTCDLTIKENLSNLNITIEQEKSTLDKELKLNNEKLENITHVIDNNKIVAPKKGTFEYSNKLSIGDVISEGTSLGIVIDKKATQNIILELFVPSKDISTLEKGQKVKFTINGENESKNKIIFGTIENQNILPKETENGNYYLIQANITKNKNNALHGIEGNAKIITGKNSYLNIFLKKIFPQ